MQGSQGRAPEKTSRALNTTAYTPGTDHTPVAADMPPFVAASHPASPADAKLLTLRGAAGSVAHTASTGVRLAPLTVTAVAPRSQTADTESVALQAP